MTDAYYKPITLEGLATLNEHDEVGKILDWLTQSGEIRDYDDEIANRIEDAKTIVRGVVALAALARMEQPGALAKRPVAWRVKDFGDGWIIYQNEERAFHEAEEAGAVMQGLYVRDGTAPPPSKPEEQP